jgi:hypothetical protein
MKKVENFDTNHTIVPVGTDALNEQAVSSFWVE